MNPISRFLQRCCLTPTAARVELMRRRLDHAERLLMEQSQLAHDQAHALKQLQAALIAAQFDAEGWRQIAHEQARQMQFRTANAIPQQPPTHP